MELNKVSNLLANNLKTDNKVIISNNKPIRIGTVLSAPDKLIKLARTSNNISTNLNLFGDNSQSLINPNTRVLHIGDSHTVGIYGREMDNLMRSTGAKVQTYGSAGSSPTWWINGHSTKSGFYSKDDEGKVDSPQNWKEPHPTPKLNDLVNGFKPNVIIISLGANLVNGTAQQIESEVKKISDIAKESGAKIVWVGPPDGRESVKPTPKQDFLYEHLQKVANQYGTFVDSRPHTEYPATGGDGVHYWGKEGTQIAKSWANNVFADIQKSE